MVTGLRDRPVLGSAAGLEGGEICNSTSPWVFVPRVEGRSKDPLSVPVDPCVLECFLDSIPEIELQVFFFPGKLISDFDFIEGEDHLGNDGLRKLSSVSESDDWSEGGRGGFLCGGLDDICSWMEGECAWCACLEDDRENRLRDIATRDYNRSCLVEETRSGG